MAGVAGQFRESGLASFLRAVGHLVEGGGGSLCRPECASFLLEHPGGDQPLGRRALLGAAERLADAFSVRARFRRERRRVRVLQAPE